jgi:predicted NAD/FAD-binding protein
VNYPNFTRILDALGVETQPTSMSFSVRCDRTGIEYNGTSLNRLFAQRRNLFRPSFHRMIRDILRFNREAKALLATGGDETTIGEFLDRGDYGEGFRDRYLVPMGSSLWSCPPGTFLEFPIRFVAEFFDHHKLLDLRGRPQWRVVAGGSSRYVERLIAGFVDRIETGTPVRSVRRTPDAVLVTPATGEPRPFDHVIFACHSDQALATLDEPTATESELLGAFPYQANEAVLHTDPSVLPRKRRAWASWNFLVRADAREASTITYNMNILQGIRSRHVFNVTLNQTDAIDPSRILARMEYHHPVFTVRRGEAQARHGELIGHDRISYCGAYWGYGFHEDGVRSALAVTEHFGKTLS